MSLYRTWRPKSFDDLVGQDVVVRTLRTALSSGKLAHAYLFSGPRGSGKTSAAKILARCIECVHGPTPDPDNTCEFCLAILAGNALDVLEIDAASNRGIDEIRALRESVKFAPSAMRMKVFIVDEAHMLTREGANAFLKTLEEPPPHAVFILATTAPEQLPPTILSRCQRYAFRRIPVPAMIDRMRTIAQAEGIAIDDAALGAIAYRADGGLRDALTMLEQVAAFSDGPVTVDALDQAFGSAGRRYAQALVRAVLASDAAQALRVIDEANDAGADLLTLTRTVIGEYRDLLVARLDPSLLERDLSLDDARAVRELSASTPQPAIVRGLRVLSDALAAGRTAGNPRLELETAVLRLVVQGEDPSLEALSTRVALLEGGAKPVPAISPLPAEPERPLRRAAVPRPAATAPQPTAPPQPAAVPEALPSGAPESVAEAPAASSAHPHPEPTLQRVRSLWQSIRTRAEAERPPLRTALSGAMVDQVSDDSVTVRHPVESLAETLKDRKNVEVIERALADVLGRPMRFIVRADAGPRTAPHRAAHARAAGAVAQDGEDSGGDEHDLLAYAARTHLGKAE